LRLSAIISQYFTRAAFCLFALHIAIREKRISVT
jgi:hypothetical protein